MSDDSMFHALSSDSGPSGPLRHVTIFTTPAGVTLSRPGNLINLNPTLEHWGLIFQTKDDHNNHDGLCIELDVDAGRIFPKRTTWLNRQQEDNGKGKFQYANTDRFTFWEDDRIERCAQNLCDEQMKGKYNVLDRNCQVLVNLLLTRILEGDQSNLGRTLGHVFSRRSTLQRLFASSEFDHGSGEKLKLTRIPQEPRWIIGDDILHQMELPSSGSWLAADISGNPVRMTDPIDLSRATRPQGPLDLREVRQNAYFWAQEPVEYVSSSSPILSPEQPNLQPADIERYISRIASPSHLRTMPQAEIDAYRECLKPIPPEADEAARNLDSYLRGHYHNHISYLRQWATRAAAVEPYLDPEIPEVIRIEKLQRLRAMNSNSLRQARARASEDMKRRIQQGEGWLGRSQMRHQMEGMTISGKQVGQVVPSAICTECLSINPERRPGVLCFSCYCQAHYGSEEPVQQDLGEET